MQSLNKGFVKIEYIRTGEFFRISSSIGEIRIFVKINFKLSMLAELTRSIFISLENGFKIRS